jgi:hypothetical protein
MLEVERKRREVLRLNKILKAIRYLTQPCDSKIASEIARIDATVDTAA